MIEGENVTRYALEMIPDLLRRPNVALTVDTPYVITKTTQNHPWEEAQKTNIRTEAIVTIYSRGVMSAALIMDGDYEDFTQSL